jgi:hypothetical protein
VCENRLGECPQNTSTKPEILFISGFFNLVLSKPTGQKIKLDKIDCRGLKCPLPQTRLEFTQRSLGEKPVFVKI